MFRRTMRKYLIIAFFILITLPVIAQQPVISNISKLQGVHTQQIEISGSGFNTNPANLVVRFGSMTGTIVSATQNFIEVIIPKGSTLSSISVTNKSSGLTGYSPQQFLQVFPGETNGSHSFTDQTAFTNSTLLFDVAIADFDGDGKNDLVATKDATTENSTATDIIIYHNTSSWGNISFTEQNVNIGNPTVNITTGDVDGDGKIDIVVSRGGTTNRNQIYVLRNTSSSGTISFAAAKSYFLPNGHFAKTVVIRDLDLDGKPEVIASNTFNNELSIFKNNGTPNNINLSFTPTIITVDGATTTNGLAIEDINHDGKPDLVISQFLDNDIFIIPNESVDGNLIFGTQKVLSFTGNLNNVAIADINLDGYQDILVTMTVEGKLAILEGSDNDFNFGSPTTYSTGANSWGIDVGDFSGNGKPDIIVSSSASSAFSFVENKSEDGVLSLAIIDVSQSLNSRNLVMGDIDGDAKPDITLTTFSGSANELLIIRNTTCIEPVIPNEDKTAEVCPTQSHRFRVAPAENATFIWKEGTTVLQNDNRAFYDTDATKTTGTYTYTVTIESESGTCSIESTPFTLTVSDGGGTIPNDPIAGNSGIACIGSNTQLTATDVTNATYSWTGPDGFTSTDQNPIISSITAQKAGIYYVIAEISPCKSGVSSTIVEVIVPPDFTIVTSGETNLCEGNSLTLSVALETGYSYKWQKDGSDIAGAITNAITVNSAGDYQAIVNNSDCDLTSNLLSVSTYPIPVPTFTTGTILCIDTEVSFTNTTILETGLTPTFTWDFGDGTTSGEENPIHTFTEAKDQSVTLTVEYVGQSCVGTSPAQTVTISSPDALVITPVPSGSIPFCEGESTEIEASGDFSSYSWRTGEDVAKITVTTEGYKVVTGSSASGCITKDSIEVIINPLPTIIATAEPDTITLGLSSQLLATGAFDYVWEPTEGLDFSDVADPNATPITSTTYGVTGTDENGCVNTSEILVTVLDSGSELPVEASSAFSPNGDGIDDNWVINGIENFPDCELVIFDRSGRIVFTKIGYNNDWNGIDEQGNQLPMGAYFYTISCTDDKTDSGSISIIR